MPGTSVSSRTPHVFSLALVELVRLYQRVVSPMFPATCRYHPSCSEYAVQAVLQHGLLRGVGLAVARLMRCNPWTPGGADPVPGRR